LKAADFLEKPSRPSSLKRPKESMKALLSKSFREFFFLAVFFWNGGEFFSKSFGKESKGFKSLFIGALESD